jgi:hypothetical protein
VTGFRSDAYEIIQSMSSLKEVRIFVKTLDMEENDLRAVNLKACLLDISTRLKVCEVLVPSHLVQMFGGLLDGTEVRVIDEGEI